jgi:hypothetical protein
MFPVFPVFPKTVTRWARGREDLGGADPRRTPPAPGVEDPPVPRRGRRPPGLTLSRQLHVATKLTLIATHLVAASIVIPALAGRLETTGRHAN